ncbi:predicted protein [Nematostella vectensis]|uniref:Major facilitator superfamily associated domain-containing protein n=1 Tax=Nematostella vectensis TaxID=45351 RepID=A7SFX9_NEMVE|nr:major facilitator superfamily domain-containing protein 6 [Nematostella vectensis]EDO37403.1 predicted protein [Nematostella vectensis]|eukprot:XP_001629466.1 predicted protein [Nematostella vectensis]
MAFKREREEIQIDENEEIADDGKEEEKNEKDQKSDENLCAKGCLKKINQRRLVSKLFYFFYFSAFGSLWPFFALYFKQLFISPRQMGILVATRAMLQFVCTPIWSAIADKYNKYKVVLLMSLSFWLIATFSQAIVPSTVQPAACYRFNSIHLYANKSYTNPPSPPDPDHYHRVFGVSNLFPWALGLFRSFERQRDVDLQEVHFPTLKTHVAPEPVANSSYLFIGLLLITIFGIIFASPAQCLADTATLQALGSDTHEYGKQALWGSVGYGTMALLVGLAVSGRQRLNPCSNGMDVDYVPCFYAFACFMAGAICIATRFKYHKPDTSGCGPGLLEILKIFKRLDLVVFLFVVFFCGTAIGFIQTFLFWHLRELGGEQELFSLITMTNSAAEVTVYTFSDRFLSHVGHFKVVYMGLLCYSLRFFYYSYCTRPWLFLPIELIQGVTTAAVWTSFVSYVGSKTEIATTLQGLVSGFYTGLGYATGGLLGGCMVHLFGSATAFLVFGEMSLLVMFLFIIANNLKSPDSSMQAHYINKSHDFEK